MMLTGTTMTTRVKLTSPVTTFGNGSVVLYSTLTYSLTFPASKLMFNVFCSRDCTFRNQALTTATNQSQTHGQVEGFHRLVIAALRRYFSEHHIYWDHNLQRMTAAYNAQVRRSTGTTSIQPQTASSGSKPDNCKLDLHNTR